MKAYFVLGFVGIVLMIMVYSNVNNNLDHKKFLDEMTVFKDKGGRNTSFMGKAVCERLNELELMHDIPTTDCQAIYNKTE